MDLIKIYNEVIKRINIIDFNNIWKEFRQYNFAIYDEDNAVINGKIITKPDLFFANTCIEYEGSNIAIYSVLNFNNDFDELTSNIVHEMFHCFQLDNNENRYSDDLSLLSYPLNVDNFNMKYIENNIIVKMIKDNNYSLVSNIIYLRNNRYKIIGDAINQEYFAEVFEGAAEYASTMALKQLSLNKYNERISRYCDIITNASNLIDIRKISYYIGTLLLIIYKENKYNIFNFSNNTFYNQITELVKEEYVECIKYNNLENFITNEINNRKNKINNFINNKQFITYKSIICGYDPMNMIRYNNYILCTHFISLKFNGIINNIMKPICLVMEENNNYNVLGYYIN